MINRVVAGTGACDTGGSQLKIYFATTVLGDRSRVAGARRLVAELKRLGHEVLTEHLGISVDEAAEILISGACG